ncbi:MAG: superoxide dismutase family protein [Caldimonas sp.]
MHLRHIVLAVLAAAAATACVSPPPSAPPLPYVVAVLEPTRGNTASGTVWLVQAGNGVHITGTFSGMAPNSEHGFHIHEKGDCSSGDGMSAGGHFNPTGKPHGPQTGEHHAGDLPSLKADASGNARFEAHVAGTILTNGPVDLSGKALIVHASPDDFTTQPTGNSGARIACGVISSVAGKDAAGKDQPPKTM